MQLFGSSMPIPWKMPRYQIALYIIEMASHGATCRKLQSVRMQQATYSFVINIFKKYVNMILVLDGRFEGKNTYSWYFVMIYQQEDEITNIIASLKHGFLRSNLVHAGCSAVRLPHMLAAVASTSLGLWVGLVVQDTLQSRIVTRRHRSTVVQTCMLRIWKWKHLYTTQPAHWAHFGKIWSAVACTVESSRNCEDRQHFDAPLFGSVDLPEGRRCWGHLFELLVASQFSPAWSVLRCVCVCDNVDGICLSCLFAGVGWWQRQRLYCLT